MSDTITQYGTNNIRPYFQSSFFVPNARWASRLLEEVERKDCAISWRSETRVDCLTSETIELLAKSGLKVVDLGMESASPQQILRMKKAREPEQYLQRATDVLKNLRTHGILAKINILLYAGETHTTVQETTSWLRENAANISGVSVGPVLVFGPPKHATPIISELENQGAQVVNSSSAELFGITNIHPSTEIDTNEAEEISLSLSRMIMDHEGYYKLKSFSYYPRDYTYNDFVADVKNSNPSSLPFDVSALVDA